MVVTTSGAWAQGVEAPRGRQAPLAQANGAPESGPPPEVRQSIGCLATGTVATVGAVWLGGENLVNLIAGGVVAPQNRAVLYVGLVGVVFASFCAIGQALTPLYVYYMDAPATPRGHQEARPSRAAGAPPSRPAFQFGVLAHVAEQAARRSTLRSPDRMPSLNAMEPVVATADLRVVGDQGQ